MQALRPEDPRSLGAYRLLGRLGEGGMGSVYLARSERGRVVAVKTILPAMARQPDFRQRFAREIATARRVGGRWTAAVLDTDTEAAAPWVATAYIAGPTLHEVVAEQYGPLPESSVRFLAATLVQALRDIHQTGLVHRDLKPSNVMVTIDGPRVIDFGIARALDAVGGGGLTRTGAVIGSPGFMSPEQVRGVRVTQASDVFSLGVVLAYAATGRMPFGQADSGPHALMFRIVEEPPDLTGVPESLRRLLADCLHKEPEQRPTVAELLERTAPDAEPAGPWLPAEVLARLGRHAIELLDAEDEAGDAQGGASGGARAGAAAPGAGPGYAGPPPRSPSAGFGAPTAAAYQMTGPGPTGPTVGPHHPWQPAPYQPTPPPGYPGSASGILALYPRRLTGLSISLYCLLGGWLLFLVGALVATARLADRLGRIEDGESGLIYRLEEWESDLSAFAGFYVLIMIAIAIVFAVWFHRMRLNAETFAPGGLRYGTGMAVGGWFIPVGWFWLPKQIANDIWRATTYPRRPSRTPLQLWWTCWLGHLLSWLPLLGMWSEWYETAAEKFDVGAAHTMVNWAVVLLLPHLAAAVGALVFVARMTRLQHDRIGVTGGRHPGAAVQGTWLAGGTGPYPQ